MNRTSSEGYETIGNISIANKPKSVSREDWIAVHVVQFYNELSLLSQILFPHLCTDETCPQMTAFSKQYSWAIEEIHPIRCMDRDSKCLFGIPTKSHSDTCILSPAQTTGHESSDSDDTPPVYVAPPRAKSHKTRNPIKRFGKSVIKKKNGLFKTISDRNILNGIKSPKNNGGKSKLSTVKDTDEDHSASPPKLTKYSNGARPTTRSLLSHRRVGSGGDAHGVSHAQTSGNSHTVRHMSPNHIIHNKYPSQPLAQKWSEMPSDTLSLQMSDETEDSDGPPPVLLRRHARSQSNDYIPHSFLNTDTDTGAAGAGVGPSGSARATPRTGARSVGYESGDINPNPNHSEVKEMEPTSSRIGEVVEVSAPKYINLLLEWVESNIHNHDLFPCDMACDYPSDFERQCGKMLRRLVRIYAHIYNSHYYALKKLLIHRYVNTSFKHFMEFVIEYGLVPKSELTDLKPIVDDCLNDAKKL